MARIFIVTMLLSGMVFAQQPQQRGKMVTDIVDPATKYADQANSAICFEYGDKFLCERWCEAWKGKGSFVTYGVSKEKGFAITDAYAACISSGIGAVPVLKNGQEIINIPAEKKYRYSKKCTKTLDPKDKEDKRSIKYYSKEKLECVFVGVANTEKEAADELVNLCSIRGWQDSN